MEKLDDKERKEYILKMLQSEERAISGSELAEKLGVSRQIIIRDIALLRAMGYEIEATYKGYTMRRKKGIRSLLAVNHREEDIERELSIIVKLGGKIIDVIVEHPLYGELKGNIQVESIGDVRKFMTKMKTSHAKPLLTLSGGIHLHTIEVSSRENLDEIRRALRNEGFLES